MTQDPNKNRWGVRPPPAVGKETAREAYLAIFVNPVKPTDDDSHAFESIGSILRRLRAGYEEKMTSEFDLILSITIDELVQREEALCPLSAEEQSR